MACWSRGGLLGAISKRAIETALDAELTHHQGLDNLTPDDVYYRRKPLAKAA